VPELRRAIGVGVPLTIRPARRAPTGDVASVKHFTPGSPNDEYKKLSWSPDSFAWLNSWRKPMKAIVALLGLSTLLAVPQQASAWGGDGHRTVAAIAFKLLPPAKAAALNRLLQGSDVREDFVDAASYPDEVIRNQDHTGHFSPWHYVDWHVNVPEYSPSLCNPDCILEELPKQIDLVRTSPDLQAKALALSWVIHLVGDLHQPLHVADRNEDRGGNLFKVRYRNRATCHGGTSEKHPVRVELHSVWDTCLVVEIENGSTPPEFADALRGALTTYRGHPAATGDIMQWAKESHELATSAAYGSLSGGDDLEQAYISKASPVVQDQLLRAGVRLAKVLDENFN
jgi:S1/P1 Nuclease